MRILCALILSVLSTNAYAYGHGAPATLTGVTSDLRDKDETDIELDFSGTTPSTSKYEQGGKIYLILDLTRLDSLVSFVPPKSGVLQNISFDQVRDGLRLNFVTTGAARLVIEDAGIGHNRLTVKIIALAPHTGGGVNLNGTAAGTISALTHSADPPPGEDLYELILLKYADVSEVVGLLSDGVVVKSNDSFTPREPGFGSPGNNNSNPVNQQNPGNPDDKPLGQSIDSSISIDRRLNAIWVRGSPAHVARVKAQIEKIDIPLTSVLLETEFVELTENGSKSIGLDFANATGQIAVGTVQTGQYVPLSFSANTPGRLSSLSLQAALYAQIQKGEGRIVSKPKIAAQSGSTAKIITGDALPILTSITLSGVNGVSQQVQYVNVGVTLQIAPRVSSDGYVSSHVFCVVSSVTGYSQGYPTISQREAETSATVPDGQAFVIGGLVQENDLKSKTKVPVLGDIPVLGQAFSVDKNSRAKTELYIVITPHIIHQAHGGQ